MPKFTKTEKIKFKHIDFAGIVFYPRFLEMLNDLVEDWFEEALNYPFSSMHQTHGMPTVDLKVQFKQAARIGEILSKELWVINLKRSSIHCGFEFINEKSQTILEGEVTLVHVKIQDDRQDIKAEAFNDDHTEKILKFIIH